MIQNSWDVRSVEQYGYTWLKMLVHKNGLSPGGERERDGPVLP